MRNKYLSITSLCLLVVASVACQEKNYSFESASSSIQDVASTGQKVASENFVVGSEHQGAPVDLVWVIDNSGSMTEEIANVGANLASFLNRAAVQTDLRTAVISAQSGSRPARVPAAVQNAVRVVDYRVNSWNSLTTLALSFCQNARASSLYKAWDFSQFSSFSSNALSLDELCGLSYNQGASLSSGLSNQVIHQNFGDGQFYRANSAKVFVVVTDDDSTVVNSDLRSSAALPSGFWYNGISASQFMAHAKKRFQQDVKVFSFMDQTGAHVGCGYKKGVQYLDLAASTSSKTFDICESDWSVHFDNLLSSVVTIAQSRFLLGVPAVARIQEVRLDNQKLSASMYSVEGRTLILNSDILAQAVGKSLKVTYEY